MVVGGEVSLLLAQEEVGLDKVDEHLRVYYNAPLHVRQADASLLVFEEVADFLPVLGRSGGLR